MPDLQIIQIDPVTGVATLGMAANPKLLRGIDRLIQIVVLTFLKTTDQDVIDPTEGSNMRRDVGQYNFSESNELTTLAVRRAKLVEKNILDRQPVGGNPAEKLKKLSILDVAADPISSEVMLRVQIFNESGDVRDLIL